MNTIRVSIAIIITIFAMLPATTRAQTGTPATNAFTFQGQLNFEGSPVNTTLQVSFRLFNTPTGNGINDVISDEIIRNVHFDAKGRFAVLLDFGDTYNSYQIFNGDERYMQITLLDPPGGIEEDFPLSPRTKLNATPLAAYALNARIPSFSEISEGTLESTDTNGSLALNTLDDDLGLTIRPNGGVGTLFTYSGIQASNPFAFSSTQGPLSFQTDTDDLTLTSTTGNIKLNAPLGDLALIADDQLSLSTTANGSMSIDSNGLQLQATNLDLNAGASFDITSSAVLSISSAGILNLTGGLITINGNSFNGAQIILSQDLLATSNAFKPGGGPWAVLSDKRQKKNITPLHGSLQTLLALQPITYEYTDPNNPMYLPGTQTGFVAQQVREVLPSWIDESSDGTLLLSPRGFEAMVVDALKELRDEKEAQIQQLQFENAQLRARLDRIEQHLTSQPSN
jgi:hypothetical protein